MSAKKAQKIRDILILAGIVIMLGAYIYEPLMKVGMVVAFSCFIPHFLYNKCPHCGKQLGRNDGKFCQHCGGRIE